ncbi:follistatin-A isoform X2 [Lingula anatina]|uniref:Follistatin-A isoform X2 n=1 Tax=Lingula anatina TaxID=7574 RepID=A0A1S3H2V5_LINAN|nr:follistatin-A isoform X2 [Lingula anatina]|eukprot:XP_013379469.1 follistatin-A isoform X2 [Lingula anatina]
MCSEADVMTCLAVFVSILLFGGHQTSAGNCWLMVGSNGLCQSFYKGNVSREECCRRGHANRAWTPEDLSSGELFYILAIRQGAPNCQPCQETCEQVKCEEGKRCKMRNGRPKCVCAPRCSSNRPQHKGPLCGTDGRMYRNHCSMLKYNCRHNKKVEIAYFGRCQKSCDNVICTDNKNCVVDQNGMPHCVYCSIHCPPAHSASQMICGADGVTYESFCLLQQATCRKGRTIGSAYHGPCQGHITCQNLTCSDNKKCLVNIKTKRPQCVSCNMDCSDYGALKVCGTDNQTYSSWCKMHQTACQMGVVIETQHAGACGTLGDAFNVDYYDASGINDPSTE